MTRKRDINDWLLWFMVFKIFMDFNDWKSILVCFVLAVIAFSVTNVIDKKMETKN